METSKRSGQAARHSFSGNRVSVTVRIQGGAFLDGIHGQRCLRETGWNITRGYVDRDKRGGLQSPL